MSVHHVVRSADEMYNNSFVNFWPKKTVNVHNFDNAADALTSTYLAIVEGGTGKYGSLLASEVMAIVDPIMALTARMKPELYDLSVGFSSIVSCGETILFHNCQTRPSDRFCFWWRWWCTLRRKSGFNYYSPSI